MSAAPGEGTTHLPHDDGTGPDGKRYHVGLWVEELNTGDGGYLAPRGDEQGRALVSGDGLTDAELRAAPLPVTITGLTYEPPRTSRAAVTNTSNVVLPADPARQGVTIANTGTVAVLFDFGRPATADSALLLARGVAVIEGYPGAIHAITAADPGELRFIEVLAQ